MLRVHILYISLNSGEYVDFPTVVAYTFSFDGSQDGLVKVNMENVSIALDESFKNM